MVDPLVWFVSDSVMSDLKSKYTGEIVPRLKEELNLSSVMEVPRIQKITLNMGVGQAAQDKKAIEGAFKNLELIAGQKPVVTLARKSVAGFKIREGWPIGVKVTLRGQRMYEFLDRLVNISLPRVRDFRGLNNKSFDGNGNYSFGMKQQADFPEIQVDSVDSGHGMDICITTTAKTDEQCEALLRSFNLPLKK